MYLAVRRGLTDLCHNSVMSESPDLYSHSLNSHILIGWQVEIERNMVDLHQASKKLLSVFFLAMSVHSMIV